VSNKILSVTMGEVLLHVVFIVVDYNFLCYEDFAVVVSKLYATNVWNLYWLSFWTRAELSLLLIHNISPHVNYNLLPTCCHKAYTKEKKHWTSYYKDFVL